MPAHRWATAAGDYALAHLAPSEAASWYETALDKRRRCTSPSRERADLMVRLGEAQQRAGTHAATRCCSRPHRWRGGVGLGACSSEPHWRPTVVSAASARSTPSNSRPSKQPSPWPIRPTRRPTRGSSLYARDLVHTPRYVLTPGSGPASRRAHRRERRPDTAAPHDVGADLRTRGTGNVAAPAAVGHASVRDRTHDREPIPPVLDEPGRVLRRHRVGRSATGR